MPVRSSRTPVTFASVSSEVRTATMMAPNLPEVRHTSEMASTSEPPLPSFRASAEVLTRNGVSGGNGSSSPPRRAAESATGDRTGAVAPRRDRDGGDRYHSGHGTPGSDDLRGCRLRRALRIRGDIDGDELIGRRVGDGERGRVARDHEPHADGVAGLACVLRGHFDRGIARPDDEARLDPRRRRSGRRRPGRPPRSDPP